MIDDNWLGHYRFGVDEEDGIHSIYLWRAEDQRIRFHYSYKCHTNHGYSLENEKGVVISATANEITVEVFSGSSASWEDLYKESLEREITESFVSTIPIVRMEEGHPVLRYNNTELAFVSADASE